MLPVIIIGGIIGLIAWGSRDKRTGVTGYALAPVGAFQNAPNPPGSAFQDAKEPEGLLGPPLQPMEERLLTLLVLWARDKKFPSGQKKFMTRSLAEETARTALRLGLVGTAKAVLSDGPIPEHEKLGRRGITVRKAIVMFARR